MHAWLVVHDCNGLKESSRVVYSFLKLSAFFSKYIRISDGNISLVISLCACVGDDGFVPVLGSAWLRGLEYMYAIPQCCSFAAYLL